MRFMLCIKSDPTLPQPAPVPAVFEAMAQYNESLVKAGVLVAGEGLHPERLRVRFADGKRTITDGPFTESKEMVAGFWIIQVKSKEEALAWALRIPGANGEFSELGPFDLEIRQVFETEEFEGIAPPDVLAREQQLRRQLAALSS